MADLNLIAIEGVQGAGKSTLILKLVRSDFAVPIAPVASIPRPKMMGNNVDNGAGLTTLTDIAWFLGAMKRYQSMGFSTFPILIDRFVVSQWVYGNLRRDRNPPDSDLTYQVNEMEQILVYLMRQYLHRSPEGSTWMNSLKFYPTISLKFLFLLPDVETIKARRFKTGIKYIYSAEVELERYTQAYHALLDADFPVAVYCPPLSKGDDLDATVLSLFSQ